MHRYYEPGYYWYREDPKFDWQVVFLTRTNISTPIYVIFYPCFKDYGQRGISLEMLEGELVGPIQDPSVKKVLPFAKGSEKA